MRVNGKTVGPGAPAETPLLYVLRGDLGLAGPKFGCGLGQCGACTVLVDGSPVRACITPVGDVAESDIVTLEGLGDRARPHPLQSAFVAEQALQCGYCVAGVIMSAAALLAANADPDEETIRAALAGNLCRCGAHGRMIAAVRRAARELRDG